MRRRVSKFDVRAAETAILALLRAPGFRPAPIREILRRLDVPSDEKPLVRDVVSALVDGGTLERRGSRIGLAEGVKPAAARPAGGRSKRPGPAARPARAVRPAGSRAGATPGEAEAKPIVGVFRVASFGAFLQSFDVSAPEGLRFDDASRAGANDGDAVLVEIDRPARGGRPAAARVVEILGRVGEPGVDALVVARRFRLATEFPPEVLEDARRLPLAVGPSDLRSRERFDDPPVVTIDGETARDFDDAISVAELPGGGARVFVHIADVGHFVPEGSVLDHEARRRGTSVYFPDCVLPMFPEKLSNDLCSLRPGEDRLVQSVILDLDQDGDVRATRFADGVIRSAARLTYTQVAAVLDGEARLTGIDPRVTDMLRRADRVREILSARRRVRGSVDFDLPEPRILLDVEGVMTGITIEPRNRAHRLIEELMLLANETVAGHLEARRAPCLYRVHDAPDPVKVDALADFASGFGLRLRAGTDAVRPRDIQRLLEAAESRPEYPIVAQVALRSMMQARYTPENSGHFGLAAPVYAHFTSPIRRYPDLVVHRLLRSLRHSRKEALARVGRGLGELGEACSRLERAAEAAERELLEWKKIAFVRDKVGESFDGIVTAVTAFGLFVQLTASLVEGLLHVTRLGPDRYEHIESRHELQGARTGKSFRLGDRLRVRLDRVDAVLRRIDLSLDEDGGARQPEGTGTGVRTSRRAPARSPATVRRRSGAKRRR